ncbi:aldehyde dehydrogenase (NADP(+)) [Actinoplanes sp. NPDC051343]|jgi:NADP-dependent aldehyde dehydrogenase|uniref:aldehyde dehydrogenase (NADP(+)) n=1 Tax=Actinoplanes sp. NPDC051343 TaxID=3363906 RepID=UPI00379517F5
MTVQGYDPRTGEPVGAGIAETTDLPSLLDAAAAAFPAFRSTPPSVRADFLTLLADRLDAAAGELVPLATAESGLPSARLTGEVARTSAQLRLFARVVSEGDYLEAIIEEADPGATPPRPPLRRWLEPVGPVLVYAASNFPFAFSVLGGDTASALAAGAPVLVKAHGSHPALSAATAALASRAAADAGLPPGVFGIVFGDEQGVRALRDPRVKACGFTGSTGGGRFLLGVANSRPEPIPFFGELGSINPAVVTPAAVAARAEELVSGFVGSFTLGTGQFCTKPGLLFLPAGHGLGPALSTAVAAASPGPLLNARIADQFETGLAGLASHPGVVASAAGSPAPSEGSWASPRLFTTTTGALRADPDGLTAEHFGPAALIVEYTGADDLLAALGAVEGSLTATVHAEPGDDFPLPELLEVLGDRAGRVVYNGWPTGVAVSFAMNHGGPWPSTTNSAHTSVGATSIRRWLRPVSFQSVPDELLPPALQAANPWGIPQRRP